MKVVIIILLLRLAVPSMIAAQEMPSDLAALVAKAQLNTAPAAWCRAEFRSGHRGAYAVAVTSRDGGGRYLALDADGRVTELGAFKGSPEMACYSRADAKKLDLSLRQTDTVHGHITPRWNTTVVCGFIDDTAASCWQYSPTDRVFVQVGRWMT